MRKAFIGTILIVSLAFPPIPISADEPSTFSSEPAASEEKEERTFEAEKVGSVTTKQPANPESDPKGHSTEIETIETPEVKTLPGKAESMTDDVSGSDTAGNNPSGGGESVAENDTSRRETTPEKTFSPAATEVEGTDASGQAEQPREPADMSGSDTKTDDSEPIQAEMTTDAVDTDTKNAATPDIVISEIQIAGDAANDDFVELYNGDSESFSLRGLELRRKTKGDATAKGSLFHAFADTDAVPGHGYFLWANKDGSAAFIALADATSPNKTSPPLTTDNSLALFDGDGNMVASVTWGSGHATPFSESVGSNPGKGESLSYDRESETWSLVTDPTPTNSRGETVGNGADEEDSGENPEPVPDLPLPGTVILNEIFPNPIDESDEWVELFNASGEDIPLAGWVLADAAKGYIIPNDIVIEGRGFLIIPRSGSGLALNNGSETVTLSLPDGTASDTFTYTQTEEGYSWARNTDGVFEPTDLPTPGDANRFPVVEEPTIAPLPPDGSIRINEVFANPETKGEADEWIEFANTSDMDISLAGFILRDASKSGRYVFGDAVAIGAGSFLVLPRSETKISLNNSAETLRLLWNDDETVVASLSYERTVEGVSYGYYRSGRYRFSDQATPGTENRFGKEPKIEHSDIPKKGYRDVPVAFSAEGNEDDTRYVWDFGDEHKSYKRETTHRYGKTGTYRGTLTVRGDIEEVVKPFTIRIGKYPEHDLRITALLPNPDGRDTAFEWIRIENREKRSVDLTGWIIATGTTEEKLVNHEVLTEDLRIGADESLMLTRADSRFSLPNKHATIELRRPDGSRADRVAYDRPDGIGEKELLMVADDGSLVWIVPTPKGDELSVVTEDTSENPFLRGMTTRPARLTFARFLALGTPFRIALPDTATQVLGLSDARIETATTRHDSRLDAAFRTLNGILLSVFGG